MYSAYPIGGYGGGVSLAAGEHEETQADGKNIRWQEQTRGMKGRLPAGSSVYSKVNDNLGFYHAIGTDFGKKNTANNYMTHNASAYLNAMIQHKEHG
jgi:hypothetical protein